MIATPEPGPIDDVIAIWPRLVAALNASGKDRVLAAMLRDMEVCWPHHFEGDTLVLGIKFTAHRQRIEYPRSRRIVEDHLSELLGKRVNIRAEVMSEDTRP